MDTELRISRLLRLRMRLLRMRMRKLRQLSGYLPPSSLRFSFNIPDSILGRTYLDRSAMEISHMGEQCEGFKTLESAGDVLF